MAPDVVWDELRGRGTRLRILDPMAGSGTTLVAAKLLGHRVIGYDSDPLAVLIGNSWLAAVNPTETFKIAAQALATARRRAKNLRLSRAYPPSADLETKAFVRYWFDRINRVQLAALAQSIANLEDSPIRGLLWCAFSRLVITKESGVSLAMDVSHSRPHKVYEKAPLRAFDHFERAVKSVVNANPFSGLNQRQSLPTIAIGDARYLPTRNASVDMVVTSPPYLNAIDYIRGHKFSLIWMGYSIEQLRSLRARSVGSETGGRADKHNVTTDKIIKSMCTFEKLSSRNVRMLRQYVEDMTRVLTEIWRVLRTGGKAILVVGNCSIANVFVRNSECIVQLATHLGFQVQKIRRRPLPENRRYLPPPTRRSSGTALKKRMRAEVIVTLVRP